MDITCARDSKPRQSYASSKSVIVWGKYRLPGAGAIIINSKKTLKKAGMYSQARLLKLAL